MKEKSGGDLWRRVWESEEDEGVSSKVKKESLLIFFFIYLLERESALSG